MITFAENRPIGLYRHNALLIAPCPKEKTETCYHVRLDPFPSELYPITALDISGDPEFFRKHTSGPLQLQRPGDAADA